MTFDLSLLKLLHPGILQDLLAIAAKLVAASLAFILILALAWAAGEVARRVVARIGEKDDDRRDIFRLLGRALKTAVILVGLISALGTIGINVTAVVTSLGIAGFAAGFAFKELLEGMMAGVLILIHRPVRRGEWVSVAGFQGAVAAVDLRYTTLADGGRQYLIPNTTMLTTPVTIGRPQPAAAIEEKPDAA